MPDAPTAHSVADARRLAAEALDAFAAEQEVPCEPGARPGEFVLVLPGEKKLRTVCSVVLGAREMSLSAFVIRHPDERHEDFFRALLRRNLRTPGLAYAIDAHDDVYVVGRLPLEAVTPEALDRLFGVVLAAADGAFDELLTIGFLTSMKREWAWRVARGESLRNLEAFRDLLEGSERDPAYACSGGSGVSGAVSAARPVASAVLGTTALLRHGGRVPPGEARGAQLE